MGQYPAQNPPEPSKMPPFMGMRGGPPGMMRGRDWTQGSIFKNLLLLSWPMAVTNTLMMLGPTIDMIWVGKLGSGSIAGVGVAGTAVQLVMGAMMGLTAGMRALIARFIGAKDIDSANRAAQQAAVVTAIYAIFMAVIGAFYSEEIVAMVGVKPEVVAAGAAYLRINFIGSAPMAARMMMDSIMQASGDSMNPMIIAISYRALHIALCPFLVFGWWIFPNLGVSGAAWTAVISQSVGVILGFNILFGNRSRLKLSIHGFRFDFGMIWRIVRIGFPALISGIQRTLQQFILMIFMAPFGTIAIAAHTISQRIEMFLFMPAMALGMGAAVLVGQNLGANQVERAEKSTWLATGLVEAVAVIATIAILIWPGAIVGVFNNEPDLIKTATEYLYIALPGFVLVGFMMVLMNAIQGAGDTVPMMVLSIVTTWVITIPFAYFLPKWTDWGVYGVRWAMTASMVVGAFANIIYFRTGRWKTKKV
jgi:putative MATE family efflux protein